MNNPLITFDDVNILPQFSDVSSRSLVSLGSHPVGFPFFELPIISANMDTITESEMSKAMIRGGAQSCLHRFQSIEDNVKMFVDSILPGFDLRAPLVSIGLGPKEIERAEALRDAGAFTFVIDVNHGANIEVVRQAKMLRHVLGRHFGIVVGNFATGESIKTFLEHSGTGIVDGFKIGIGPGSSCLTRTVCGIGVPQLSALIDCKPVLKAAGLTMIADGGMKTAGDVCKAIAAGADLVMSGGLFSGCEETPGLLFNKKYNAEVTGFSASELSEEEIKSGDFYKKYRGSASLESYKKQGKVAKHRAVEGESFYVPYKGPVADVLQNIEGGIKGAFSMVGAWNMKEFHAKAKLVQVSNSGAYEGQAWGKK